MTNADKFKAVFGMYSEEFWAKPEQDMLRWINSEYQEHQTNADRIRAMSDKDLADLLSGGEPYPWCEQDPCPAETCQECILMWLKQEAKHDL